MPIMTFKEFSGGKPVSVVGGDGGLNIPSKEERKSLYERAINRTKEIATEESSKTAQRISEEFKEQGVAGKIAVAGTVPLAGVATQLRTAGRILTEPLVAATEALSENKLLQQIAMGRVGEASEQVTESVAQKIRSGLDTVKETVHPEVYDTLKDVAEIALWLTGGKIATAPMEKGFEMVAKNLPPVVEKGQKALAEARTAVSETTENIIGRDKPVSNIDEVIQKADEMTPADIRAATEQATAKPTIAERIAGVRPDIKNRIAGKPEMLQEYFDVARARNNFDTLPTPMEYGVKRDVLRSVATMEEQLKDTGGQIGSFRQKIQTYKAHPDAVKSMEDVFVQELGKLNLEVKNTKSGTVIRQSPGTVRRVSSDREIAVLNELWGELMVVKQSPDLGRLIDLRNVFDGKIKFEKSAREVSTTLDPFSREMRKRIANIAAEMVGKSEAKNLEKYSQFMDAYNLLKSYTDRSAGGEFLLKQVFSERGRAPREVMETIKEFTGIDLMDTATMVALATDLIGNSAQKGVFRQEVTRAGLDVASILGGNTTGASDLVSMILKSPELLVNKEKQFLKAAGGGKGTVSRRAVSQTPSDEKWSFTEKGKGYVRPNDLKIGLEIKNKGTTYRIVKLLGEGKFRAVPVRGTKLDKYDFQFQNERAEVFEIN